MVFNYSFDYFILLFFFFYEIPTYVVTTAFFPSSFREPQPFTKDNSKHLRLISLFFPWRDVWTEPSYPWAKLECGFNCKKTPQLLQSFVKSRQLGFNNYKTKPF